MAELSLQHLDKIYDNHVQAVFDFNMEVKDGEVMPVASPVGYPAEKKSIRESLMRKGLKADDRKPFDQLFFVGGFNHPLPQANPWAKALEMAGHVCCEGPESEKEKQIAFIRENHEKTLALYDAYCAEAEKRGFWAK